MANQSLVKPLTLSYLLETRRYLVLTIAAGLVAVGLTVFGTLGQVQAIFDLVAQQSNEARKLDVLEAKITQLEAVNDPSLINQSELVNLLLPNNKPLLELLNTLNTVSGDTQIQLQAFQLTPGSLASDSAEVLAGSVTGTGVLSVEFEASGTLGQLNQFMSTLEQTTPLITITGLSLHSGTETQAKDRSLEELLAESYQAEVTVEAAYFTQSVTATLDNDLPKITPDQERILSDLARFTTTITPAQSGVVGGGLDDLFGTPLPPLDQR